MLASFFLFLSRKYFFDYNISQPIFPPSLHDYEPRSLVIESGGVAWYQPISLEELLGQKASFPKAKLVVGNTEVGIEVKYKAMEYPVLINPGKVRELLVLEVGSVSGVRGVTAGASVTINRLRQFISNLETEFTEKDTAFLLRGLSSIRNMLTWFASNQIRNVACIGGNIVTASPISDLNPMLLTCGASLILTRRVEGVLTRRVLPIKEFFLSYRRVDLADDEILESVFIPFTSEFEFVVPFKQARRREDDISIVTCGIRYLLSPSVGCGNSTWGITSCTLAFGGMAPTTVAATKTAAELENQAWTVGTIENAFISLRKELSLPENVPGGQAEYRMSLAVSFLFKSYFVVTNELAKYLSSSSLDGLPPLPSLPIEDVSAADNFVTAEKPASRGEQHFSSTAQGQGIVGQSLQHKNADYQVSGETKYTGDMPLPADALHACLVTSTR